MRTVGHLLVLALLSSGCVRKLHRIPGFDPEFVEAEHSVLPRVEAETCGIYVLYIDWAHLFSDQRTRITGTPSVPIVGPRLIPEESRGLYHALEKAPAATHLMSHRAHVESKGVLLVGRPLFGERCAEVSAMPASVEQGR